MLFGDVTFNNFRNVLVVTINYRLGALGFLTLGNEQVLPFLGFSNLIIRCPGTLV